MIEPDNPASKIRHLLRMKRVVPLGANELDKARCPRAGVILFHSEGDDIQFYLLLPKQKADKTTPPDYQIAKGGRSVMLDGGNVLDVRSIIDLKQGIPFEPAIDALREGVEEQGLKLSNVDSIYEIGHAEFTSVSKGTTEPMWLIAADVSSMSAFDVPSDPKTESCRWFSLRSLRKAIESGNGAVSVMSDGCSVRSDHIKILVDFASRLGRHKESSLSQ